jgi:hypothetical protein
VPLPPKTAYATLISSRMKLTRLAVIALAALVLPDAAAAGIATIRSEEIPLGGARSLAVSDHGRFDLVGVHWRGSGRVELRTRSVTGRWSAWHAAAPEEADAPDLGSAEERQRGWRLGNPWWAGLSDRLQVRTHGPVMRVRVWKVRSPESLVPLRQVAAASEPAVVARSAWGADEAIRRGEPSYATELRYAIVHHTAGANGYTRAQAPAILRGIQLYHVQANGWNDIGYNFLVDRFGTVYEGRYGGIDANVIGAQAQGFNTSSVGVALLGTYGSVAASTAAEQALVRLLSWRLDLAHVDPGSMLTVVSGGSPKFAAGVPVLLRSVSGHRDVGLTACPGDALYARLQAIGAATRRAGLPKLYDPVVSAEEGAVIFRARLSEALPWTVTVTDTAGAPIAAGSGAGSAIEWLWDSSAAIAGDYHWSIAAGAGSETVTPAAGLVSAGASAAQLALNAVAVEPGVVSPNGDGSGDTAEIAYTLTRPATVSIAAVDAAGAEVAQIEAPRWRRAGDHTARFDGAGLPDGLYTAALHARSADGSEATASIEVAISRTLGFVVLTPALFSPNGDGRADRLRVAFTLTRRASVTVRAVRNGATVATLYADTLAAGRRAIRWDGRKTVGTIGSGAFTVAIEADDGVATARAEIPFAVDTTAPKLQLVSRVPPRVAVSEAAALLLRVNGVVRRLKTDGAATLVVPGIRVIRTLQADARDRAGNAAVTLRVRRPPDRAK